MARTHELLTSLERQLAVARAEVQRARAGADAAAADAQRLHAELEELRAAPKPVPVHTEVSDRMAQILRLASEEAELERSRAGEEISRLRTDTQAECERLVGQARADAERELEQARATARAELGTARETANRELTEARQSAEADLNRARAEAEITVTSARTEADQLRLDSVRHAEHLIEDAQRRSGAVNGLAAQRLDALTGTHTEALSRLGQIRDVLSQLLNADSAAGSLSDAVEAAMNARPQDLHDPQAAAEPIEGEIYEDPLPSGAHQVIDVDDDRDYLDQDDYDSGAPQRHQTRGDDLDDLNIDPRDPLGQGTAEQPAIGPDLTIDLREESQPGVSLATGSAQAAPGGQH